LGSLLLFLLFRLIFQVGSTFLETKDEFFERTQTNEDLNHLFHVIENGRSIRGSVLLPNHVIRFLTEKDSHAKLQSKTGFAPADVTFIGPSCEWCNDAKCHKGDSIFFVGKNQKLHWSEPLIRDLENFSKIFNGSIVKHRSGKYPTNVRSVTLNCQLRNYAVDFAKLGVMRIKIYHQVLEFKIFRPYAQPPKYSIICGKALYGKIDLAGVAQYVKYYTSKGVDQVILYDVGASVFINWHHIQELLENKSLVIINIQAELHRMYGHSASAILMQSHTFGQSMLKQDCHIRSILKNASWVLHLDLDEFLTPGFQTSEKLQNISMVIQSFLQTQDSRISALYFIPLMAEERGAFCEMMSSSSSIDYDHLHSVMQNTSFRNNKNCTDFMSCRRFLNPKYAIRPQNIDYQYGLEVHQVTQAFKNIKKVAKFYSVNEWNIYHPRCLSDKYTYSPFWWVQRSKK